MYEAKSGKAAPAADRMRVLPAIALLACIRYTSIMYYLHVSRKWKGFATGFFGSLHIQTLHEDHEDTSSDWDTSKHLWYPTDMWIARPLQISISAFRPTSDTHLMDLPQTRKDHKGGMQLQESLAEDVPQGPLGLAASTCAQNGFWSRMR